MEALNAIEIEPLTADHWEQVREIYLQGIATADATFATEAPSWQFWDESHLRSPRLVALRGGHLLAWAALSPVSTRKVYRGVAEVSIYVDQSARGKGVGRLLLGELIEQSEADGIWTLQAGILVENLASIRLHQAAGFRTVGRRERIGKLGAAWRDVLLLERRSSRAGI